jgi:hypothetical protein
MDRVRKSFVKDSGTGCWLWTGRRMSNPKFDYGIIRLPRLRKNISAHRLMFALKYGLIPNKLSVLHKCDTPRCVNPHHLFLGTQSDNHLDMVSKNRHHKSQKGFKHPSSIFTEQTLTKAKELKLSGYTFKQIASIFGCTLGTAYLAINGIRYSDHGRS